MLSSLGSSRAAVAYESTSSLAFFVWSPIAGMTWVQVPRVTQMGGVA